MDRTVLKQKEELAVKMNELHEVKKQLEEKDREKQLLQQNMVQRV